IIDEKLETDDVDFDEKLSYEEEKFITEDLLIAVDVLMKFSSHNQYTTFEDTSAIRELKRKININHSDSMSQQTIKMFLS
ncbi:MAG: hypothetical protein MHPSP_004255, partial [Paramarteilia canceri]